jgi:hypothetical protein
MAADRTANGEGDGSVTKVAIRSSDEDENDD